MVIAVSGKGGVGKSTVAALIVRRLVEQKKTPVLAVDADPNSTLGDKIGLQSEMDIGQIREETLQEKYDAPAGVPKQRAMQYELEQVVSEGNGFDLVVMGRGEGPGCYCSVNNMLRTFLHELSSRYAHLVMDNEAGMEHISRLTSDKVDLLLVVSDPTPTALKAAQRIGVLSQELGVVRGQIGLLLNRDDGSLSDDQAESISGLKLLGRVAEDPQVKEYELANRPLLQLPDDSVAVTGVAKVLESVGVVVG